MKSYKFGFKTSQKLTKEQLDFLLAQFNKTVLEDNWPTSEEDLTDLPEEVTDVRWI